MTQVVLPLEGVFEVHGGHESVVADATSAVILEAGRGYRVGHPGAGGDRSTVLVFPPEVVEDALDPAGPAGGPVRPRVRLGASALVAALRRGTWGELEVEEAAYVLLGALGADLGRARSYRPPGRHQLERVERVRALLASAPDRRWRLQELALEVHCSPFHLARQFRAIAGRSIGGYVLGLRMALAVERLAQEQTDLAALAADLGFTSHSHFTARFRAVFGDSPSSVRRALTSSGPAELRTFVTAVYPVAS